MSNINAIAIHPTEEDKLKSDFHYREVQWWAIDMIEGGLERMVYKVGIDHDKKPFWTVAFHGEHGCVIIHSLVKNAFETMNLVHDAFLKGRA